MEIPFEQLSLMDKAQLVWDQGHYITSIEYYQQKINLYSLGAAFIEVIYSPNINEIEAITEATEYEMRKYIGKIELPTI